MKETALMNEQNTKVTYDDVEEFFRKHEEIIERVSSKATDTIKILEKFRGNGIEEKKTLIQKDMEHINKIEAKTEKEFKEHAEKLNLSQQQLVQLEKSIQESKKNLKLAQQLTIDTLKASAVLNGKEFKN